MPAVGYSSLGYPCQTVYHAIINTLKKIMVLSSWYCLNKAKFHLCVLYQFCTIHVFLCPKHLPEFVFDKHSNIKFSHQHKRLPMLKYKHPK